MSFLIAQLETLHPVVPGLLLAVLIGVTLILVWRPIAQWISHRRLLQLVRRLGVANLKYVSLPDGLDGEIYIEHLILRHDRILIVTIKPFKGNLFGAEHIDQWTQVIGHRSYKFPNPLHQQQSDLQVIKGVLPKIHIDGLIVFTRGCLFPKGKPEGVMLFDELKAFRKPALEVVPLVQDAWDYLMKQVKPARHMRQAVLYRRSDKLRLLLGVLISSATIYYALWYLGVIRI